LLPWSIQNAVSGVPEAGHGFVGGRARSRHCERLRFELAIEGALVLRQIRIRKAGVGALGNAPRYSVEMDYHGPV